MSVVYRDRERERFDDTRSTTTARTGGGTKITRYVVKDDYDDSRSRFDDRQSRYETRRAEYDEGDRHVEETRITRKSREDYSQEQAPARAYSTRDGGVRSSRETITIRRDEEPERRREYWREPAGENIDERELVVRRTETDDVYRDRDGQVSRFDERRESRFSDYEIVSPQRRSFDDRERDVQRYIRNTEYYQPQAPQQPQTIIIRQEPIIIRERDRDRSRSRSRSRERREEDYQVVKRSDFEEERSVARRTEPREEEYFYEKKVRERLPDDRGERRLTRREVSPGDSISQVGRRGRHRGYESDDSMVYVRKEKITEGYSSDDDGHRKRDLAAGVVAGVGAAEIIRRHNEKEGKEVSRGGGRLLKDAGAGIVGAVAAEGIHRYRSKSRRRGSRSRSRSDERSRYSRRRGDRSRSRSRSNSNLKNIGGLGLAAAAVAAGALIASRNKKEASPDGRRSRSRSRRGSRSRSRAQSLVSLENDPNAKDDRNPGVRNKKTALAGAAGAAAMAIYEHHRSKSRGRGRSESPNRIKQGLPIVGGGLAAAGLAHLYEKRKAKEEAEDVLADENRRSRSRASRSRSRARTESTLYGDTRAPGYSDPGLISYGNEPLHGNNYGEGYYGRPGAPEQDYYNNNTRDIVPVPAAAPPPAASSFDATARRPRSASRTRSLSADGRSRSRSRGAAAAAAAVGAGVAASEYDKRRKEKKERKRRSRDRERNRSREGSYQPYPPGADPYEDANYHATHTPSYAAGMHDPYASQSGFYPQSGQFPPPPGSMPQPGVYAPTPTPQTNYGPQDFPPPPAGAPQAQQMYADPYGQHNAYAPRARGDENVSAATFSAPPDHHQTTTENGLDSTRELAMSPPIIGPNVTLQRPSTSTASPREPPNQFPGDATDPFSKPTHHAPDVSPREPSPGQQPTPSPMRPDSRAARTYTPPNYNPRAEKDRSASAQPSFNDATVPDGQAPPLDRPVSPPHDPRLDSIRREESGSASPPERKTTRNSQSPIQRDGLPHMPSPDFRPPSDPNLVQPIPHQYYANPITSGPFIPDLEIPVNLPPQGEQDDVHLSTPAPQKRQPRERSRPASSESSSTAGNVTPRATSPAQDTHKKSVSFAAKPEFSDAPSTIDNEREDESSRRRRRERDRERDRHHRSHEHNYDAGDDFSEDTLEEDHRRRSYDRERERERDRDRDKGNRHSSRRERSNTQSLDRESGSTRDRDKRDPRRSNTTDDRHGKKERHRDENSDSDSTVDLPDRFDKHGRPKSSSKSPDEEMIAQSLDKILGLFGSSGKRR